MAAPRFVHLRLHSEFSIVDGTVRSTTAVAAAVADGMPALALTDLANVFGLVKFYQRGARARRQAHRRLRCLANARGRTRPAVSGAAARAVARRISAACRVADPRVSHQPAPRPRRACARLVARRHRRADRAFRRARRRGRQLRCCRAMRRRSEGGARMGGSLSGPILPRGAARGPRRRRRAASPPPRRLAGELALPVVATHPVQFLRREDFRAHEARVCIAEGFVLADARRPRTSRPSSISRRRPRWPRPSPTFPRRSPTRSRSRSGAT